MESKRFRKKFSLRRIYGIKHSIAHLKHSYFISHLFYHLEKSISRIEDLCVIMSIIHHHLPLLRVKAAPVEINTKYLSFRKSLSQLLILTFWFHHSILTINSVSITEQLGSGKFYPLKLKLRKILIFRKSLILILSTSLYNFWHMIIDQICNLRLHGHLQIWHLESMSMLKLLVKRGLSLCLQDCWAHHIIKFKSKYARNYILKF